MRIALLIRNDARLEEQVRAILPMYLPLLRVFDRYDSLASAVEDLRSTTNAQPPHLLIADISAFDRSTFDLVEAAQSRQCTLFLTGADASPDFVQTALFMHPVVRFAPKPLFWIDLFACLPDIAQRCGLDPALYTRRFFSPAEKYGKERREREEYGRFTAIIMEDNDATRAEKEVEKEVEQEEQAAGNFPQEQRSIALTQNGEKRYLDLASLLYVKSDRHYLTFYALGEEPRRLRDTIGKYEKLLLDKGFARAHRSYSVALEHIQDIDADFVYLCNGKRIPLSKGNARNVREARQHWRKSRQESGREQEEQIMRALRQ